MTQLYTLFFILSVVLLIALMFKFNNRVSSFYILLFCAVAVENLGYMQMATATDIKLAIYANQVVYVGASTIPFFLLMCLADLCKIKIGKGVEFLLFVASSFLFLMASSVGVTPWYYSDVELVTDGGVSYLAKTNGSAHMVFLIYLAGVFIAGLWFVIKSFQNRKVVSYKTSVALLVLMLITILIYIVEKAIGLHVELLPFAFVNSEVIILHLLRRVSLYDVRSISAGAMVDSMEYGFVVFDTKGNYLGSDDAAKYWFEELCILPLDKEIPRTNSQLFIQLRKWMEKTDSRDKIYITNIKGLIIEARHIIVKERRSNTVHCVYLKDETKHQQYDKLIKKYNDDLENNVKAKTDQLKQVQEDIIISMASIVENRDNNTGGHIQRTSDIVKIFVNDLRRKALCNELTPSLAENIIKSAALHDFGKIAIPDRILNKEGKFEPEEYEIMKQHSAKGAVIVERILQNSQDPNFKKVAVNVAHYHHEKWDGNGYPERLSGTDIPFEARVMALADVFDALVSKRVYKEKFSYDKAFGIIEESCGTHFDPKLCTEFLSLRPKLEELYNSYPEDKGEQ